MKKLLFSLLFLLSPSVFAVTDSFPDVTVSTGTATITRNYTRGWTTGDVGNIQRYNVTWTSSADGNATVVMPVSSGKVVRIVTDPAGGGSAPTDDYDITWLDEHGADLMAAGGANRDTANTEQFCPLISTYAYVHFHGSSTIRVTNAGNAKSGVLTIYISNR